MSSPTTTSAPLAPDATASGIRSGSWTFFRVQIALFCGGFATFAMLYSVQPLFPLFADSFHLTPAHASLALSTTTGVMSVMLIVMSAFSDRYGRRAMLIAGIFATAVLQLACAFTTDFTQIFVLRTLEGIAISAPPAIAMAYLSEEIEFSSIGFAMGFYISGTATGGMCGRFFAGLLAEHWNWEIALGAMGVLGLVFAAIVWILLPASKRFKPRALAFKSMAGAMKSHLFNKRLHWLFLLSFILQGCFVSVFSYMTFRLLDAPFSLGMTQVSLLYLLYLFGVFSSTFAGKAGDLFGLKRVLWMFIALFLCGVAMTLSARLWLFIAGLAVVTFGFFGAHSVAASWVGATAKEARGLAAALYLFAYYFGSSVIGTFSGTLWNVGGWNAIVACLAAFLLFALGVALMLYRKREG